MSELSNVTVEAVVSENTSEELLNTITNTLLLNGGLRDEADAIIQMRFADLPTSVKEEIRSLIEAKLSLRQNPRKK
jgi:hypothetical protein